jgi:hypothetical protein
MSCTVRWTMQDVGVNSRQRRPSGRKASSQRSGRVLVAVPDEPCDCPDCNDGTVEPEQLLTELVEGAAGLADLEDPTEAELTGALFVAMARSRADDSVAAFTDGLIPALAARGGRPALAVLTAIAAMADGVAEPIAVAARAAAGELTAAGVPAPVWAGELGQPMTAGPFSRLHDTGGTMSVLIGSFRRGERVHALVIVVDDEDCGAADQILLVDGEDLPDVVATLYESARLDGVTVRTKTLGAPEFRWYAEQAIRARAAHDEEDGPESLEFVAEDGPGYAPLAVLTGSRLGTLPAPRRPRGAVESGHSADHPPMDLIQQIAALAGQFDGPPGFGPGLPGQRRAQPPKLPARRKKSNGRAPAYQLKVSLRGAKPPIWRRLLVPGDITLDRLHQVLQAAFGWNGDHLYVFDTAYGQFGRPDRELGHRSDGPVTLEQVAAEATNRIRYTYDFGDDWDHEILVEKVSAADPAFTHPVCTGGRRAAPPDDCGGIYGYQELVEVLADPGHPEHRDRLEWLGLADASGFTPHTFDIDGINEELRRR